MHEATKRDAQEYGLLVKQGDWRLGLLVARNVENRGRGKPKVTAVTLAKVTATEFAKQAGTSTPRVLRHLEAWERAADDGHVPPASELSPGEEIELDAEKLPPWWKKDGGYYEAVSGGPNGSKDRPLTVSGVTEAVTKLTPEERAEVAEAVLNDPEVVEHLADDAEQTARVIWKPTSAIEQRMEEKHGVDPKTPRIKGGSSTLFDASLARMEIMYGIAKAVQVAIEHNMVDDALELMEEAVEQLRLAKAASNPKKAVAELEAWLAEQTEESEA